MNLIFSYFILFLFGSLCVIFSYSLPTNLSWFSDVFSNIGTGIFGSLIVIFLVDKIIEDKNEEDRKRRLTIALHRIRYNLQNHIELLCSLYKSSVKNKIDLVPTSFDTFFNDDFYNAVSYLDFSKKAPSFPETDWFEFVFNHNRVFNENIYSTISSAWLYD